MMKRKFLAVVLPIIGCATVVGSGFSAWYFGTATAAGANGGFILNIGVTDEVKADSGALSISDTVGSLNNHTLLLDQGGYANLGNADSGIMVTSADKSNLPVKTTTTENMIWAFDIKYKGSAKTDGTNTTIGDLYDAGMQIRYEFTITLPQALANYIEVKDSAKIVMKSKEDTNVGNVDGIGLTFGDPTGSGSIVYKAQYVVVDNNLDSVDAATYSFSLDMNTTGDKFTNALFKYKDNMKPDSDTDLAAMKKAIVDTPTSITFAVTANLESVKTGA